MKWTIVSVICGVVLVAALVPAAVMAAKKDNSIRHQQHEQRVRIKEGLSSGELTRPEAKQLRIKEKMFRAEVKAARANGKIGPEDRARLTGELNRLNEEINIQTHKPQERNSK